MSTYFNDILFQPTDEMLASALGETKEIFDTIVRFIGTEFGDSHIQWKHYGSKIGWSIKILNKKRNVMFVGPEDGYFRVAFAFGQKAYLEIIESNLSDEIKQQITNGKVYVEGRPLRLEIRNQSDAEPLWQLIKIKLKN
jgi:hypothetical protein